VMGWVLDRNWDGMMEGGIKIYHLGAYQAAFSLMMIGSILSAVLICFTTETHCQQMVK
jgi:hypothetical protein